MSFYRNWLEVRGCCDMFSLGGWTRSGYAVGVSTRVLACRGTCARGHGERDRTARDLSGCIVQVLFVDHQLIIHHVIICHRNIPSNRRLPPSISCSILSKYKFVHRAVPIAWFIFFFESFCHTNTTWECWSARVSHILLRVRSRLWIEGLARRWGVAGEEGGGLLQDKRGQWVTTREAGRSSRKCVYLCWF